MSTTWPFPDPPNAVTMTTRHVMELGMPILMVTHDADDGCWQMLCGTTDDTDDAHVVGLVEIYKRDSSIGQLADLPRGWRARCETANMP
jgi:hypothetical protein